MVTERTDRPLLVTAVGGAPGFDLTRMLLQGGYQVVAADSRPYAAGLMLPGVRPVKVPPAADPGYPAHLLELCRAERPAALLPTSEQEILRLIEVQGQLDDLGVRTWLPSRQAMTDCHDKAAFHQLAVRHGIPVPRTWLPEQLGDVPDGMELVVKARRGHGGKNLQFCRTVPQARTLCELIEDPIVQQRIAGAEFTADCLAGPDGTVSVIPRRRLVVKNGLAMAAATFRDPQVSGLVTATVTALGITGLCCVQGFVTDGPERVVITEVNGRIAGAFPISVAAGADLIGQFLNGLFGQPIDHDRLRFTPGIHLVKYVETIAAGPLPLAADRPVPAPVLVPAALSGGSR